MNFINKLIIPISTVLIISACNTKKESEVIETKITKDTIVLPVENNEETVEGTYETKAEENDSGECRLTLQIIKTKNGYSYFLKTKSRELKGTATFKDQKNGEKYLVLEGIKWAEYEGDISNEEENDSVSDSKDLEIPVGISASYVKDTLTIQNSGNSMNYYTKLSECDRKYILLIKVQK